MSAVAVVRGADFKNGVAAAVPGWENVRLLAPHAELRLLVCGQSTIIDAHRLRCMPKYNLSLLFSLYLHDCQWLQEMFRRPVNDLKALAVFVVLQKVVMTP